ncbi:hypothetical protein [Nostoc linckia]|uniref:hypothetical protein n=1 Tax=Nostoc linckia TaxID=92942 RepID=UPI000AA572C3|nr:hypothetical protein [Nostoc linckia]
MTQNFRNYMDILDELYILDENKQPIKPESLEQWSNWRKNENNIQVALDTFSWGRVSTIFLGKDYSNFPNQEPQLFETMVFGGEYSGKFWRYSTWEQAVAGHQEVCMIAI